MFQFATHIASLLHKQFARLNQTLQIADFVNNAMTLCMRREPINIGLLNLYRSSKVPNLTYGKYINKNRLESLETNFANAAFI